jgi:hypothetical protein
MMEKLFSDNLRLVNNNMELAALQKEHPGWSKAYVCLSASTPRCKDKEWMESLS